jgi:hypothetical protein
MRVNYSDEEPILSSNSIFLAGPTPRSSSVKSWRPEAISILESLDFSGVVYVPEHKNPVPNYDYLKQVEWEYACLEQAGVVVFWVPRKLPDMPAFTTNVEFGRYVGSGRVFYGRPDWAEKKGYLDWLYRKVTGKEPITELTTLLQEANG